MGEYERQFERQILHVDIDAFFAAIEQQTFPLLRGKPVGVCGNPHGRTVVAAASYEAKRKGVKTGMTVAEAYRCCPEIVLIEGNPAKYVDTAIRILAFYTTLTDLIEVFSIDEAFLDVTRSSHLWGGPEMIAVRIKRFIRSEFGLTCSVGIGPNKLLAKLVCEQQKPDGLARVRWAEVPALMAETPVEQLCGVGPQVIAGLRALGIRTCLDLSSCSESKLVRCFGITGSELRMKGAGYDDSEVMPYFHEPPTKSMGHSVTLEHDTNDWAIIREQLVQLSGRVGQRLRAEGYAGRTVILMIRYSDFSTHERQHSYRDFINDDHRIYRAALKLYKNLYRPPRLVRLLGVRVSNLVGSLWLTVGFAGNREVSLFQAADSVNTRWGGTAVAGGRHFQLLVSDQMISPAWRPQAQRGCAPSVSAGSGAGAGEGFVIMTRAAVTRPSCPRRASMQTAE